MSDRGISRFKWAEETMIWCGWKVRINVNLVLPSNIHVTKEREADSHLALICSVLNYVVTCTCTITFMGGSQEADILTPILIRWNNSMMKNHMV